MVATNGAFSQMKILTNKLCGPHNFINSYLLYSWSKTNINLFLPQVKVFLPCSHHNLHLHLHPWPINSNSQAYFHHCLEWALYIFSNLPPSLLTFPRRPGSLSQAVSLLNLIVRCQWENSCLNISISLGCLSLSNFESKQVNVPTPPCKKKNPHWLHRQVAVCFCSLLHSPFDLFPPIGLAWCLLIKRESDWHVTSSQGLHGYLTALIFLCLWEWGPFFSWLLRFFLLCQLPPAKECAIISTAVPNAAKTPAPSDTAARSVVGITPPTKPGR